jgi:hypothetical protein
MESNLGTSTIMYLLVFLSTILVLLIASNVQNWSLVPPPKERDFGSALANWAHRKGLHYAPQKVHVISGIYNDRWFTIVTANEENALQIRMSVKNPRRNSLQIFGDWLEANDVIAFANRFRIYSSPSGLSETLFDLGTGLRDALLRFPGLRARLEMYSDSKEPNQLRYSLLTDLPEADMLESIMASMDQFCEVYEHHEQEIINSGP